MKPLVPAFIWAGDAIAWDKVFNSPPGIIVVNPNNGPGSSINSLVAHNIKTLAAKGWEIVGYVSTSYLTRPLIEVTRDITLWRFWYPQVKGVFFDEIPGPQPGILEALTMFESAATRLGGRSVFNPGVRVDLSWFKALKKSVIVTYEGPASKYTGAQVNHTNEAHIIYGATQPMSVGAEYGYVTRDDLPNPYSNFNII